MKFLSLLSPILAAASCAAAYNATGPVTYLGSRGAILSGGTSAFGLVFSSGTIPSLNGTIVSGGIRNETAQVIRNIAAIFREGGTSWAHAVKTTVYLADMGDFAAMNEVYSAMIPSPKPARTTIQAGRLPGNFSVEIEAIAVVPYY